MPANNTDQSSLRAIQGGSPTTRGQNQRAQRTGRASNPNTSYNNSNNNSGSNNNMFSAFAGGGYSPFGMFPMMGQYGNQQSNLGRYRPPMMGGGGWNDTGGYAYNLPNAYGSTGLNYMSGFNQLANVFNPFMGYQAPDGSGFFGQYNQQQQQPVANRPLRTPLDGRGSQTYMAGQGNNQGQFGRFAGAFGTMPGMQNTDEIGNAANQMASSMNNYRKPMALNATTNQTSSVPYRLPTIFGG